MGKITGLYTCPSCSRQVTFRSAETRLIICSCQAVLHRLESDDLVIKNISLIPDDNDLLQTGAEGSFEGHSFVVIGRFRCWLEESVVNYWTILFDDGSTAMLAEGYGLYAVLRPVRLDKIVARAMLNQLGTGGSIELIGQTDYFLKSKDECWRYEIQGEVFLPESNDSFPLFDLYARGDKHLEIMEFLPGYLLAFQKQYAEFISLKLTGLNTNPPESKEIDCPFCHKSFAIKTFPYAQSCSCPACGTRIAFHKKTGSFRSISRDKPNNDDLSLPLGAIGTVKGISYEVIGYAWKEDNGEYTARWKEYVLYNRQEGYAFLSEYAGNWIYAREKGNSPVTALENPQSLDYGGTHFQLYSKYTIKIIDTAGEFPYDIYDDKQAVSAEFIAPPFMWVYEKSREEGISWFLGEHISRSQLIRAFQADLPDKTETGLLEPRGFVNMTQLFGATFIGIAILTIVHFGIGATQQDRRILENDIEFRDSVSTATYVSPKFDLGKWRSNLEFDIKAPVDNNWADLDITLVNSVNGTERSVGQLVEYYHGYEDGESWSEGSTTEQVYINSIPAGSYFLRIEAERDTTVGGWNNLQHLSLVVRSDVPMHRNYFIFLALLLIWPVVSYFRMRKTDRERWMGSAYSPYKSII